ncbi:MAG: phosphoglucosamine mutase, partial [Anaerovoracaceae bacterium]
EEIQAAISEVESKIEGSGRVLIRPSGTEPLVRVMLEGEDIEQITVLAEDLAKLLTKKFG